MTHMDCIKRSTFYRGKKEIQNIDVDVDVAGDVDDDFDDDAHDDGGDVDDDFQIFWLGGGCEG